MRSQASLKLLVRDENCHIICWSSIHLQQINEKERWSETAFKKQRKSAYKGRLEQIHVTKASKYSMRDLDLQVQYSHFTDEETDQVMNIFCPRSQGKPGVSARLEPIFPEILPDFYDCFSNGINQGSANFDKGPDSTYFRFCRPYCLCCIPQLWHCKTKAVIDKIYTNGCSYVPGKLCL